MSRFEEIDDEWYWRGADGLIKIDGGDVYRELARDPLFREYFADELNLLEQHGFKIHSTNEFIEELRVVYKHDLGVNAYIGAYMPSGEKYVGFSLPRDRDIIEFAEFKKIYKTYYDALDENASMRTELAAARERISALEAENTELRYRPGGPGYDEAAEHFSALIPQ